MKTLETERLILRKYAEDDFAAVHSYANCVENTIYMVWGPNTEEQTKDFIKREISKTTENLRKEYNYAVVLKDTHRLIGGCGITLHESCSEVGWILHRDYWKQGYCTEMGQALLKFGFEELNLRRIIAYCDFENIGSYRVMEKIGMRREGVYLDGRPAHKLSDRQYSDELSYGILKDEWETHNEIAYYNSLPLKFNDFIDLPELSDGVIYLVCTGKYTANPEKKIVPAYHFAVCMGSEKIGGIDLRIGYTNGLYYGGQIGYGIDEKYRGNGYAGRACRLLLPVAKAHNMTKLLITNNHTNTASRRVCEKLGTKLLRVARLPEWHDLYQRGQRFSNIYEWSVD